MSVTSFMRVLSFSIAIYILGSISGVAFAWWWMEKSLAEWERSNRSSLGETQKIQPEKKAPKKHDRAK